MHKLAVIIVLDSFGIGSLPDANKFGDFGSNTLGHIDEYCHHHNIKFHIPNLLKMGLGKSYFLVNGKKLWCDSGNYTVNGSYGACQELSSGKDTTSGHWEMLMCPVLFDWGYFIDHTNSFPKDLLDNIVRQANLPGYLGNCHASGTEIIQKYGNEHINTLKPIFYTSADSVFQIACHEKYFGLNNLYELCELVRQLLSPYKIARVIARPFTGDYEFIRTDNRKDYSLKPHHSTLWTHCINNNIDTIGIGKIPDIYAHTDINHEIKAHGLKQLCQTTIDTIKSRQSDSFIMTNLVDFDMLYGHRRDVLGYKNALEEFDTILPSIVNALPNNALLILSADHGCDPTWHGTDHTREYIPFLMHKNLPTISNCLCLGIHESFSSIGLNVAKYFGIL